MYIPEFAVGFVAGAIFMAVLITVVAAKYGKNETENGD